MKTRILFDNSDDEIYGYDSYLEYCSEMDKEPAEEDSQEYYDWYQSQEESDWKYAMDLLSNLEKKSAKIMMTGIRGLWDGKHECKPALFDTLDRVISTMSIDANETKITQIDKITFEFEVWHHDGKNDFEFRFLRDECYDDIDEDDLDGVWEDEENFIECVDNF